MKICRLFRSRQVIIFAKDKFERYTVRGLFYRINYSFAGKYLLETNGRYDGSSKFPKNSRFGFFPFGFRRMAYQRGSVYETFELCSFELEIAWFLG